MNTIIWILKDYSPALGEVVVLWVVFKISNTTRINLLLLFININKKASQKFCEACDATFGY